jgi:hypothetical protein
MVALPAGAVADSVTFTVTESSVFPMRVRPAPAQRGVPTSRYSDFVFTPENPEAYSCGTEVVARLGSGYPDGVSCRRHSTQTNSLES